MDETWVNVHHNLTSKWYNCLANPVRDAVQDEAPTGKGKRLIILDADYEGGFLPDCSLVLVGKTNSIDYQDEMNGDHFAKWFEQKLLPNLLAGAAVVMNDVPYHTVKTEESWAPTSKMLKAGMQVWLMERNTSWNGDMLKSELYELVKKNKPEPQYVSTA